MAAEGKRDVIYYPETEVRTLFLFNVFVDLKSDLAPLTVCC